MKKTVAQPEPFLPAKYDIVDMAAIQAVMSGVATPEQQQRAITWIVHDVCGTYEFEYRTEPRDHAFASGRRFVGLQIVKMLKLNKAAFKEQA